MRLPADRRRKAAITWAAATLSILLCSELISSRAEALDAIGTAVVVEGQVSASFGGHRLPLARGDGVVANEILHSEPASSGQISFVDQTKLLIGPGSTVTLDKFVFDPSGSASRFAVDISRGALRFISGRSAHGTYRINTPLGSLGLRGTLVDVVVRRSHVVVTNLRGRNQGQVFVTAKNEMLVTLEPGDIVILTRWGIIGPEGLRDASQPDFASACGGCAALHSTAVPVAPPVREPSGSGGDGGKSGDNDLRGGSSSGSPR